MLCCSALLTSEVIWHSASNFILLALLSYDPGVEDEEAAVALTVTFPGTTLRGGKDEIESVEVEGRANGLTVEVEVEVDDREDDNEGKDEDGADDDGTGTGTRTGVDSWAPRGMMYPSMT